MKKWRSGRRVKKREKRLNSHTSQVAVMRLLLRDNASRVAVIRLLLGNDAFPVILTRGLLRDNASRVAVMRLLLGNDAFPVIHLDFISPYDRVLATSQIVFCRVFLREGLREGLERFNINPTCAYKNIVPSEFNSRFGKNGIFAFIN